MPQSPVRTLVLCTCIIIVGAGTFVSGFAVGARWNTAATDASARIQCPTAPGFTATRAANERVDNCEAARAVQVLLLETGVSRAQVQVWIEETRELLGPDRLIRVVAQVDLDASARDEWDAEQAARTIAAAVGTTHRSVTIVDDEFGTLFAAPRDMRSPSM